MQFERLFPPAGTKKEAPEGFLYLFGINRSAELSDVLGCNGAFHNGDRLVGQITNDGIERIVADLGQRCGQRQRLNGGAIVECLSTD